MRVCVEYTAFCASWQVCMVDISHVHTTRCMKCGCGTGTRNMFVQEVGGRAGGLLGWAVPHSTPYYW